MTNVVQQIDFLTLQQLEGFAYPLAHDLSVVAGFGFGCLFWLILFWIVFGGGRR